ncbi:hypothetical protein K440DRAFT_641496 [Wilcoxina mikolae CBS 423.85]|nr:hypothetical protein K440DRAFT_641496 [Wilcoxina mikolae CBS 423.85]
MALLEEKLWLLLPTLVLAILLAGWVRGQAVIGNTDRRPHELEVLYDPESNTDAEDESSKGRGAIVEFLGRIRLGPQKDWVQLVEGVASQRPGPPRSNNDEQDRAIIFIGHSFGGLLVKQALIKAGERNSLHRNIADSTIATVFLGVPHQGSNRVLHRIGSYVAFLNKPFGSRTDLLDLVQGSSDLYNLHCQFLSNYRSINCICFYECVPEYLLGIDIGRVVSEKSAIIPGHQNIGLNTDHRGINKFESVDDKSYIRVLPKIRKLVDDAPATLRRANDCTWQESFKKGHRMVPYSQNIDFIRREDLSARLVKLLASPKTGHHRVALSGLGGTGYVSAFPPEVIRSLTQGSKTQITLDYAYGQFDGKCHIFWVYGKSHETFSQDYQKISTGLKLPKTSNKEDEILLGVKHWLESDESGEWLLILDNADNPLDFEGNSRGVSRYLPQGSKGTLIVTTRSKKVANRLGCTTIDVAKMKPEEAEDLFMRLHKGSTGIETTDTNTVHELLLALDYLPLAIAAATAYMKETGTLLAEYLDILNSTRENLVGLLKKGFYDIRKGLEEDVTESVLSTFFITFERIEKLCPLAANFIKLIAFLDQRAVPELFLTESGLDGAKDRLLFNQARGYLFEFSLISRDTNRETYDIHRDTNRETYDIHRLVHLAMETYALQNSDKAISWKGRALDIVSRLFPPREYKELATCTAYLPHVLAVLRHADESKTNSLKLYNNLGMYFLRTGQYRRRPSEGTTRTLSPPSITWP